ncbi:MAG: DUF4178 domain-containing protein [Holophagaceae bacterium]|nr:DUF4178 domain-containing protein [Holophagaceae bacterium]
MVSVCSSCGSLSARTDRDPELIGKMAALVDTGSPLKLGVEGRYAGRAFALAGRVQMSHPLGGVWDEWYMALDDGRWGWLAEAQGKFLLTFEEPPGSGIPAYDQLQAGAVLRLGEIPWVVGEASFAAFASAEGEIPWKVVPGATYRFADLQGAHGAFATLDYGAGDEPPTLYAGREVSLDDLAIRQGGSDPYAGPRLQAKNLQCPQCGGALRLHSPDQAQRVGCPYCGSLLDASGGKLAFLKSLKQPDARMFIPLGTDGVIRGVPYTCIGYLRRFCKVEGETYPWGEYLLLDRKHGFHWLTESDGHWSLVDSVSAGDVQGHSNPSFVVLKGQSFRRYQDVDAKVDGVYGEFYWKVERGETAHVSEYISPPMSLASETQQHKGGGEEINWSLSTYIEPSEIWHAFSLPGTPPAPKGVAPHMPNPLKPRLQQMTLWMVLALGALVALVMVISISHRNRKIFTQTYNLMDRLPAPDATQPSLLNGQRPSSPGTASDQAEQVFFSGPIEIGKSGQNLQVKLDAPVENAWLGVEGALVSEQTGEAELFELTSSYYHGTDGGESWSEGGRTETVFLSGLKPGPYMLRLAPVWEGPRPPVQGFRVEIRSGVVRWLYVVLAFFAIILFPLLMLLRVMAFEGRRWAESMYGNTAASSSDSSSGDD